MPGLMEVAVPVQPHYFRSTKSPGYIEADVAGELLYVRSFWDEDSDGDAVVFMRLADGEDEYMYVAVHWATRTIAGTAFASTDKQARRLLLEDLERRGWSFG
jgi:hypothetical protein